MRPCIALSHKSGLYNRRHSTFSFALTDLVFPELLHVREPVDFRRFFKGQLPYLSAQSTEEGITNAVRQSQSASILIKRHSRLKGNEDGSLAVHMNELSGIV